MTDPNQHFAPTCDFCDRRMRMTASGLFCDFCWHTTPKDLAPPCEECVLRRHEYDVLGKGDGSPCDQHSAPSGATKGPATMTTMTDQRPVEDFQRAAIERGIRTWTIHGCRGCGYPCGYVIEGEGVLYDSGCWCMSGEPLRPSSWVELAEHYNRNQPSRNDRAEGSPFLAEMRAFWGFDE